MMKVRNEKLKINLANQLFFVLISCIVMSLYYFYESFLAYFLASAIIAIMIFILKGFQDLKTPITLFNYFYYFFVVVGYFFETILRGFNPIIGFMILISILAFNFFLPFRSYKKLEINRKKINNQYLISQLALLFCALAIFASFAYFAQLGNIPLFYDASPKSRIEAMTGMGYLLQPMRFGPIAAIILYLTVPCNYKKYALILFFVCNLFLLGTGFRGTFFQNILLLIISVSLVKNSEIGFFKSLKIGFLLIFFVISIGFLRGDSNLITSLGFKVIHSISVSTYILNLVVVSIDDFKYGATFFYKFSSLLPLENIEYTQWLTSVLPIDFNGGVTPTILGDMYINFGMNYWFAMVIFGLFVMYLEKIILRSSCNFLVLFFILNVSIGIARSATGGISNTLFQTVLACLFIYAFIFISKIRSNSYFGS